MARAAAVVAVSLLAFPMFAQLPSLFPNDKQSSAKMVQMVGQVSVLKGREPWVLNVGDFVQARQEIVTGLDGYAQFQVNDGSTFEVFPNSHLIFRNNSGNLKDLLDLFLGRVKVHIQKFGGQPNPNRVTTPTAVISVRGTIFDVQIEDQDSTTLVVVDEGLVDVRHALLPYSETKRLSAGEYLRVYRNQPIAQKSIDRGNFIHRAMQVASDVATRAIYQMPRGGAGSTTTPGGGAGGGVPTDTGAKPPPPPPPPPTSVPPPPPN